MALSNELTEIVLRAIKAAGEQEVAHTLAALTQKASSEYDELTIVGNEGMHSIPDTFVHGEKYVATSGNLDLSSCEAIERAYIRALISLAQKLRERTWKKVYFIPTGPTTLGLQIKLLVYHITRLSTIDLFYSRGDYHEIALDYRSYLAERSY